MDQQEMDRIVDQIVDGLFSVCVTLGCVPVIRCPKGNAAELVAEVKFFSRFSFFFIFFICFQFSSNWSPFFNLLNSLSISLPSLLASLTIF